MPFFTFSPLLCHVIMNSQRGALSSPSRGPLGVRRPYVCTNEFELTGGDERRAPAAWISHSRPRHFFHCQAACVIRWHTCRVACTCLQTRDAIFCNIVSLQLALLERWRKEVWRGGRAILTFAPALKSFLLHLSLSLSPYQPFPIATSSSRDPRNTPRYMHLLNVVASAQQLQSVSLLGLISKRKGKAKDILRLGKNPESRSARCFTVLLLLTKDFYAPTRVGC